MMEKLYKNYMRKKLINSKQKTCLIGSEEP